MFALEQGFKRPCCVGATGIGKGAIIAESVGRLIPNGKVVCLVDRAHLVHQLADEIERHMPKVTCGRVADGACQGIGRQVVVATVQAMYTPDRHGKPLYEYKQFDDTKAVFADECHRFFADSYRSVLEHFVNEHDAVCPLFTATPVASNGARWESFVDWTPKAEGPCMRTVGWCVRNGYLVRPTQAFVRVDLDLSSIYERLSNADPESVSDSEENEADELSGLLVNLIRDKGEKAAASFAMGICELIGKRQAIIFSPARVEAAKLLATWIQATGRVSCEPAWGARPDKYDVINRFKSGTTQALTSVILLSDGLNTPKASFVGICRLIKEWRTITQMVGRGLRPDPSCVEELNSYDEPEQDAERRSVIANSVKPDCLVVDLKGNDGRIYQQSAIDVLFANESADVRHEMGLLTDAKTPRQPREEQEEVDIELLEEARSELLRKQNEQLNEMARKRAMAGELDANVSVTYNTTHGESNLVNLPDVPMPQQKATLGEQARFVAMAVGNGMSVEQAARYASTKSRQIVRGWTNSESKKLGDKKPNWNAARRALPSWAAQKGKR